MGGRGARYGISDKGNKYGSQYHALLPNGENIKFVSKNTRQSEALLETMTKGRIYATIGGKELIRITFFDDDGKRNKVIEKDKRTGKWHVHHGYEHSEYSEKKHDPLLPDDQKFLDKVQEMWKNHN